MSAAGGAVCFHPIVLIASASEDEICSQAPRGDRPPPTDTRQSRRSSVWLSARGVKAPTAALTGQDLFLQTGKVHSAALLTPPRCVDAHTNAGLAPRLFYNSRLRAPQSVLQVIGS